MLLNRAALFVPSSSSSLSSCKITSSASNTGKIFVRRTTRSNRTNSAQDRRSDGFGDERNNNQTQRFDIRPELVKITKATASSIGETTSFSPLPPVNPLLDDMPDPSSYLVMSSQPVILFYSSETKELATKVASENANIELGEISWE